MIKRKRQGPPKKASRGVRWEFLYSHDRWVSGKGYKVRSYKARTFLNACDKMLSFVRRRKWETTEDVQIDEVVVEHQKRRCEHVIGPGKHPLAEFVA